MLLTLVSFFAVLMVLVMAHELGHFFTARIFGIRVDEFAFGFPPRLLSVKRGETRYSINALPLGGYVKLAGEEDASVPRSLASKSGPVRVTVLAAGALMNALLPLVLFSVSYMVPQSVVLGQVSVVQTAPGGPAALAGVQENDVILAIDEKPIRNSADLQRLVQLNLGSPVAMTVKHADGRIETVNLVPRWRPPAGQGAVGVQIRTLDPVLTTESYPFWEAVPKGIKECFETYVLFKNGLIGLVIGTAPAAVAGPVGIAQITGEAARAGISPLLEFAAFLSINLAIVNLLPLPALDGGRIAFVIIEKIRRKRISPKVESLVHAIGFAMLMTLILAVTFQDIVRIFAGQSIIP